MQTIPEKNSIAAFFCQYAREQRRYAPASIDRRKWMSDVKGNKRLLILDGQGGGVGRKIAERLLQEKLDMNFIVVGTNAAATSNMMKAGVPTGATGENAWLYNCLKADIIVGPIGIVLAHSMHGEVSPEMALTVTESDAKRILIPVTNQHVYIAGLPEASLSHYLEEAVKIILRHSV